VDSSSSSGPWAHIHLLGVIAQLGSFTLAAQRLKLSKAAVSQQVAELERVVGFQLIQRTTRSMRLTEAGQRLVDETAASFAHIARSVASVRDMAGEARGVVRLTAPVALGRQAVAPALETFARDYPQVRVELSLADGIANLVREGFDLAVRHTSHPPDNHVAWKLCASRTLLVGTAGYLRRHGAPRHPSELVNHPCLTYLREGVAAWQFERTGAAAAGEPERVSVAIAGPLSANNSEILRDAVLAGIGLAQLPDFSAAAELRAGRLREVLAGWRPVGFFGDSIYAVRPWSPTTPRAVQLLVERLRSAMADGFPVDRREVSGVVVKRQPPE